jgi:hypothetical protein
MMVGLKWIAEAGPGSVEAPGVRRKIERLAWIALRQYFLR